jgi:hypothetical protein
MIDTKFSIHAKHKTKRYLVTEHNGFLFLARDAALPAALEAYLAECERLGSGKEHLASVAQAIEDVKLYQQNVDYRVAGREVDAEVPPPTETTEDESPSEGDTQEVPE